MKNMLLLISFVLFAQSVKAQSDSLPDPETYFSAIIVSDIEESIEWYSNIIGFKILNKTESKERGFIQANLKRGNVLLELIELNSSVSSLELLENRPNKTRIHGFFKLGFLISEFDKWINYLKKSEVEFNGTVVKDEAGKKMVIILDPDGNRIQLFEK